MFRRPSPESAGFHALLSKHGEELVGHVYRGILDREPEEEGSANWSAFLRNGGQVDDLLRQTLASREFLNTIWARLDTVVDPERDLAPAETRMTIVANCQGEVVARAIQAFTGCKGPKHRCVSTHDLDDPRRLVDPLRGLAAENDVILMQPALANVVLPLVPEIAGHVELFPNIGFTAFHPDLCSVYRHPQLCEKLQGPLGPYHSSIAYHAWKAGMSANQAIDHFRADVYETLRFHDYWDASVKALHAEGRAAALPLEGLLERWRTRGCFMRSTSHPKLATLVDVAHDLLVRLGIQPLDIEPTDFIYDFFASSAVWPIYPEIGKRLGVPGNYSFKPVNHGVTPQAPIRFLDLQEFVERSFTAFNSVDPANLRCDRRLSERYREVFGDRHEGRSRIAKTSPLIRFDGPRLHPYSDLKPQQFWSKAVAGLPVAKVDPVSKPRFNFTPQTRVVTAGSCFAQHIGRALTRRACNFHVGENAPTTLTTAEASERQFGVYSARYGNLYTPRQLVQLVERAQGRFKPAEPAWLRPDGRWADPFRPEIEPKGFVTVEVLQADRARHLAAVLQLLESLEVFVFTLGLTETWLSAVDGAVFPLAPGVVAGQYDSQQHLFKNFTHDEVVADLDRFIELLKEINPHARVLLTVSPVPLAATYEDRHILASTVYSKSVLRAAAEKVIEQHPHCDYFPSYEIVSTHYNRGSYYESDLRSITHSGVDHVMRLFFQHYLPNALAPQPDAELLAEASAINRNFCEEERLDQPTPI